jgi:hypothetical protein
MRLRLTRVAAAALFFLPVAADAQISRMRPDQKPRVGVELAKPFIADSGLDWYTSVLRGRIMAPTGSSTYVFGDWGVSAAGGGNGTDATFANPEFGIGFVNDQGRSRASLSVVLPFGFEVGDDDISAGTGIVSDIFWPERFSDEVMSANGAITPELPLGDATALGLDLMLSALIPTNEGDTEFVSRYGLAVTHETSAVRLRGGVEGFALLSNDGDASFSDRSLHRLAFGIDGVDGGPGFFIQLPIDSELDQLDAVLGLTFTF